MRLVCVAAAFASAMLWSASARAADVAPVEPASDWTFVIAPYLWGAGLKGDIGLFGREPVDVDMSFADIFDDLKFGGMVIGEASNGTWGVFTDLMYVKTDTDASVEREVLGVPAALSADVETDSFTGALMGEYRVLDSDKMIFDVMAGLRLWSVDNDISATLKADGTEVGEFSGSDDATWVDPMIGVKARIDTDSPFFLTAWGMIGGFGVGSDFAWDAMGGVGYEWNDRVSTIIGYRALSVDYDSDGFEYDVIQHGVIAGAVLRF